MIIILFDYGLNEPVRLVSVIYKHTRHRGSAKLGNFNWNI